MTTKVSGQMTRGVTRYVRSVAELEALSLAVGTNVYLTEEGRAGEFEVKSGTPPSDTYKALYITLANGNYAERIKKHPVELSWFGVLGDWNGSTGTDNYARFVACSDYVSSIGGGIIHLKKRAANNDYLLSDGWNITSSNTFFQIDPGVTLRTNVDTGFGHTMAFLPPGALEDPRDYTVQSENVGIFGGGTIRNTAPGTNENAVAFVCCHNWFAMNLDLPESNRKALTAQIRITSGFVSDIEIGTTGNDALTIEGDSVSGTYQNEDVFVENVIIASAGGRGCNFSFVSGPKFKNLSVKNITVKSSTGNGVTYSGIQNLTESGVVVESAGLKGVDYFQCENVKSQPSVISAGDNGVRFRECSVHVKSSPHVVDSVNDAILVDTPSVSHLLVGPSVTGTGHTNALSTNSASMTTLTKVSVPSLVAGSSGVYGGGWPPDLEKPGTATAADGDTTPSVFGARSLIFNNTAGTFIGDFDDGVDNQLLHVYSENANTTISFTASIVTATGANVAIPADGSMQFFLNGTVWHEVSRSF